MKEEERRQFIELLTQVAESPNSRLAIVTTMRADFLEPCLSYESLTKLIQNEAVYMPPLLGAELEYEHINRNDESWHNIRQYILENPWRWTDDPENPQHYPEHQALLIDFPF
jgi:hypothetical protein